ncbi:hypothetical protein [Roseibacillus persicicus]|uniref:Uncharacterized protein n=1 Tax=Roseibacillus persicicus TaxID=454148 RepID=A0A918WG21_9BACT|nr:hypothetical protein [Roseibacillus persicicus]GHC41161.1 hypothetical protein GCM10007100_02270 [Roseibacillus persicicus]
METLVSGVDNSTEVQPELLLTIPRQGMAKDFVPPLLLIGDRLLANQIVALDYDEGTGNHIIFRTTD